MPKIQNLIQKEDLEEAEIGNIHHYNDKMMRIIIRALGVFEKEADKLVSKEDNPFESKLDFEIVDINKMGKKRNKLKEALDKIEKFDDIYQKKKKELIKNKNSYELIDYQNQIVIKLN